MNSSKCNMLWTMRSTNTFHFSWHQLFYPSSVDMATDQGTFVVWQPDINAVMLLSMGKEQEFFFQLWHHAWLVCFLHYNTIWWQQIFLLQLSSIHRETVKLPPYDDNNNYAFNHILFCETIPYQENCPENREPMSLQFMNKWWLVCFLYCNTIWWKQIPIAILFNPYRKREVAFIWWGHQLPFQSHPFLWNYLL